jgi:amino acid permease
MSPFLAFCFTINYILGTGFLTIPWAFVQGGLILSTILFLLAAITSDISKGYLLETVTRAEEMLDDQMHWI